MYLLELARQIESNKLLPPFDHHPPSGSLRSLPKISLFRPSDIEVKLRPSIIILKILHLTQTSKFYKSLSYCIFWSIFRIYVTACKILITNTQISFTMSKFPPLKIPISMSYPARSQLMNSRTIFTHCSRNHRNVTIIPVTQKMEVIRLREGPKRLRKPKKGNRTVQGAFKNCQ